MVNTVTQRTLLGEASSKNVVRLIHIVSDGSEETDLVIYDNSTLVNDVAKGNLVRVIASGSDAVLRLEWDQTADSPAISINPVNSPDLCFKHFGGIGNPGDAGATGDLVLTTASLDAGDEVTLIIEITQN